MKIMIPSRLSDSQLVAEVNRLARCERQATALLVAHLAELDARRLHLAAGFPSLFMYCREVLELSEQSAYNRIFAARGEDVPRGPGHAERRRFDSRDAPADRTSLDGRQQRRAAGGRVPQEQARGEEAPGSTVSAARCPRLDAKAAGLDPTSGVRPACGVERATTTGID